MPHTKAARSEQEQAKVVAAITQLFEHQITFNQTLGFKVLEFSQTPVVRFDMRAELVGHFLYGRLHGGVTASVLDAIGGFVLMCGLAYKHPEETCDQIMQRFSKMGTIDLRVDYLRPGIGQHFIARATATRMGGRIASTQMTLHNDDNLLVATGCASYVIS